MLASIKGKFSDDASVVVKLTDTNVQKLSLDVGRGFIFTTGCTFGSTKLTGGVIALRGAGGDTLGKTAIKGTGETDGVFVGDYGGLGFITELSVKLGGGDDFFTADGNRITGKASFDGGAGADQSEGAGNTFSSNPTVENVETRLGQW